MPKYFRQWQAKDVLTSLLIVFRPGEHLYQVSIISGNIFQESMFEKLLFMNVPADPAMNLIHEAFERI